MMTQQQQPNPGRKFYDDFADKIGMVPNIRLKDNLLQGIAVVALTLIGALVGFLVSPDTARSLGAGLGALAGLIGGGLLSGLVLMIVGLLRKS
jgi:hypothetical protein